MTDAVTITFPKLSDAEANKLLGTLELAIRDSDRNISVERQKQSPESQDAGATLGIILGSAALTAVAKGIAAWMARHAGTAIKIEAPNGARVEIKYATGQDTAEIVRAALENVVKR